MNKKVKISILTHGDIFEITFIVKPEQAVKIAESYNGLGADTIDIEYDGSPSKPAKPGEQLTGKFFFEFDALRKHSKCWINDNLIYDCLQKKLVDVVNQRKIELLSDVVNLKNKAEENGEKKPEFVKQFENKIDKLLYGE